VIFIHVLQESDLWWAALNAVMNNWFP